MQFQVPQFIEVEDKIIGPLTFKQFVWIAGSASLGFVGIRALPAIIAYPLALALVAFGLALAFYRVNNRPFIILVQSFFFYIIGPKLYLWKKRAAVPTTTQEQEKKTETNIIEQMPSIGDDRLKKIAWSLDSKK